MRIALSLLSLRPGQVGGAETYVRALVRHLPAHAGDDRLLLVLDRDLDREIEAPGFTRVVMPYGATELVGRRIAEAYTGWRDRLSARALAAAAPDVTFFPQQSIFPHEAPGPAVLGVGDVQHLHLPDNFGLFDRTFRPRVYPRSMERAARIVAVSRFTARTLVESCGIPGAKIDVVTHGVEPRGDRTPPAPPPELRAGEFLYYPAATWPHKGHDRLLRTYAVLRTAGEVTGPLVLSGSRTPLWERELGPLARRLGIAGDVRHRGFVPREQVEGLLAAARAVVFPTRYEGFGLPVVEAAEAGARIVASRLPVFDEIGLPAANQVDFDDPAAVAAALRLPAPTRLAQPPLGWDEVARRTLEVLRAVGSGA